jgi:hypothetical protein
MDGMTGSIIGLIILILISWKGYKKFKKPILWLGFIPIFSIIHNYLGWHILALAFRFDSNPDQFPFWASIVGPTYIGVGVFGLPLEAIGFSDDFAYTIAFGLNSILIAVLIVLIIQWIQNKMPNKSLQSDAQKDRAPLS